MKLSRAALLLSACSLFAALAPWTATAAPAARGMRPPVEGEVIVHFKADAAVMRAHVLAARAGAEAAQTVLGQRAATLGLRHGIALQAGASGGDRIQVVRASDISTAALIARLQADPDVEYAVPNGRVHISTSPNDPLYLAGPAVNSVAGTGGPVVGQWYLRAPGGAVVSSLDIETAWAKTTGSASIVVAVLDTGVRPEHPDLAGRLLPGYDFVSDPAVANDGGGRDADPTDPGDWITSAENRSGTFQGCGTSDSSWHGTSTSSLIGAATNNGIGMAGTAPGVSILPVRVIGKCGGDEADIVAAMRWAAGLHVDGVPDNTTPAKVLNMSLGGCTASGDCSCNAAYQSAVNDVLAAGAVIVVAAGNSSGGPVEAPGSCAGVIAVAAVRHVGTKVGFSSLGPEVAISAPGGNCVNTSGACLYPVIAATNTGATVAASSTWFDSYTFEYGTSFSAPLVAGTAGLMFSAAPGLTPALVRSLLMSSARTFPTTGGTSSAICHAPTSATQDECYCTTTTCGAGMLNAGAAVTAAAALVSTPVARITVTTASPTAGSAVSLSATASTGAGGSTITVYQWTLTPGSGIVTGFSSADNASTVTLMPTAAGSFKVTLAVTDGLGNTALSEQTVTVAAAPVVATPSSAGGGGGGGGGGAMSAPWLALLALAVGALFRAPRRRA